MFSALRTSSQSDQPPGSAPTTSLDPPTNVPTVDPGATGAPVPDCDAPTLVHMNFVVKPVLDLTVCKPVINVTNKAVCIPVCDPDIPPEPTPVSW